MQRALGCLHCKRLVTTKMMEVSSPAVWLLACQDRQHRGQTASWWLRVGFSGRQLWLPLPLPLTPHRLSDQSQFSPRWWVFISQTLSEPLTTTIETWQTYKSPARLYPGHHLRTIENFLEKNLNCLTEANSGSGSLPMCQAVTTSVSAKAAAEAPGKPFW